MKYKKDKGFLIVALIFCIIYCLISLVNHYNFRTYALDLGAYTNALYDYIHLQWNDSTSFLAEAENLLADHFDIYLIIFSPLSLVFGSYTLLVVQIFFVIVGGYGVFRYFLDWQETRGLAIPASIFFFLFFGVFSAISYDYHSNVVAASLVPWFLFFVKKRRLRPAGILFLLIVISKENISLWLAFICLGLVFEYRNDKFLRNFNLSGFVISLFYFIAITSWVMPAFSNNNAYPHFHYSVLGDGPGEALLWLIRNPIEAIRILFINHTGEPLAEFVKAELHILLLISGLPFLLRKPQYLLMLVPIYFQKLYHDNYILWGIYAQYNIEFAPILAIGTFSVISLIKGKKLRKWVTVVLVLSVLVCTVRFMDNTVLFTNKSKVRLYKASHYSREYNVKEAHKVLSSLPADAVISAQSPFLPHLALRDNIYQFPIIKDAEYVLFSSYEEPYPLTHDGFEIRTRELAGSTDWEVYYKSDFLTVLKRK